VTLQVFSFPQRTTFSFAITGFLDFIHRPVFEKH
jgi:hypothetical protein